MPTETPSGIPNVTAHLALTGTQNGSAADRFDYYLGNIFSPGSIDIDVEKVNTSFSFRHVGGSSGSVQLLSLLTDNLSNVTFGDRDFKHQIFNAEEMSGKLYDRLQSEENRLQNVVDKARQARSFHGSIFANDHLGTSEDIRLRCKLSKAAQYLQSFYRDPWILLAGNVLEHDLDLFDTLLLKQSYATKYKRPASRVANYAEITTNNPIPDIRFHYTDIISVSGTYTSVDKGIMQIGFLAGHPTNVSFLEALPVLSEYLCMGHLSEVLTTGKNALCSSISIDLNVEPRCEVVVTLNEVPKYFLNRNAVERFFDAIGSIKWNLKEIQDIVARRIRRYTELTEEDSITNVVFERLRYFQLYCDKDDSLVLKRLLNPLLVLNEIIQFSAVYWQKFVRDLFVENCSVVVGVPDNNPIQKHLLNPELTPQRGNRDKRLRRSTELLKEIFKPNDALCSQELIDLASAPIFPFHKIFPITLKPFHWNISGIKLNLLPEWFKSFKQLVDPSVAFSITVHPIESEFVRAVFLFDLRSVEMRLRYYVLVFIELLNNGSLVSAREMQNELLKLECKLGFDNNSSHILQLSFKVVASKLELVEKWFHAILCNSSIDELSVVAAVHSLIEVGRKHRQNGLSYCNTLLNSINLERDNEDFFLNQLVLEKFYNGLMQSLLEGNYQELVDSLHELRNRLLNSKINLHLVGNPVKFASPYPLLFEELRRFRAEQNKMDKITIDTRKQSNWPSASPEIHIIGSLKQNRLSSHLVERLRFDCEPFSDSHAAISIFCWYFSKEGGIFWRCLKEDGHANKATLEYNVHKQTLTLTVAGMKNPKATRQLILYLVRNMFIDSIDSDLFKTAQRSLTAQIVEQYSTVESTSMASIFNDVHGWTIDKITSFVHKILVIKEARCQILLYDLIAQMSAGQSLAAIMCPNYQVPNLMKTFQDILKPTRLIQHTNDEQFELS